MEQFFASSMGVEMEPQYKTMKIPQEELEIHNYIMQKSGWELSTCFQVEDNCTYLCTYKKK